MIIRCIQFSYINKILYALQRSNITPRNINIRCPFCLIIRNPAIPVQIIPNHQCLQKLRIFKFDWRALFLCYSQLASRSCFSASCRKGDFSGSKRIDISYHIAPHARLLFYNRNGFIRRYPRNSPVCSIFRQHLRINRINSPFTQFQSCLIKTNGSCRLYNDKWNCCRNLIIQTGCQSRFA